MASRSLSPPLAGWRLADLGPSTQAPSRVGLIAGLAALALAIAGVGGWLYRESTRELRLAAQRVSFVSHVSHELKTPLTNVRLYSELLDDHVPQEDELGRQRLGVVVAESQRLSRLITNILTFARGEKGRLSVKLGTGVVDDVVREAVARFAPAFAAVQVEVESTLSAPSCVRLDVDALHQIMDNLLGNVEKYAPRGRLQLATRAEGSLTIVDLCDEGPGIPQRDHERVFQPFVRLGAGRLEAVPGTGIGLGIARDLARLHGGDLRVLPRARGAHLQLVLRTEPAS